MVIRKKGENTWKNEKKVQLASNDEKDYTKNHIKKKRRAWKRK
jgi:hypothetical protein